MNDPALDADRAALAERRRSAHEEIARAQAAHAAAMPAALAAVEKASAEAKRKKAEWEAAEKFAMQAGARRLAVENVLRHARDRAERDLRQSADPVVALAERLVHGEFSRVADLPAQPAQRDIVISSRLELRRRLDELERLPLEDLGLAELDARVLGLCDFSTLPLATPPQPAPPATAEKE